MKTKQIATGALLIAATAALTLAIRVPVPATKGYINLGDTMIFISALLFGARMGLIAGGIGSALADLLGGYFIWAPFTLIIKGAEGFVVGKIAGPPGERGIGRKDILIMVLSCAVGGVLMFSGYFLVQIKMFGLGAAFTELPGNLVQAGGSLVLAVPLVIALKKVGVQDYLVVRG